ncbi:MAG: arylsulfatase [Alphaproteobacteria bacterium]|nr:arylsulfatase [Alphaproteobacteria bacterium]
MHLPLIVSRRRQGHCGSAFRSILPILVLASGVFAPAQGQEATPPNIVIILADDLALMDFGVYGGEARTPNIDALAARGALFTQYRTSPLCSPSRAMLLTGMDSHRTGVATIPEVLPPEQKGRPGYTMALEPGVLTLADRLAPAGYRRLMTGKWHLGETADEMPHRHGFDRSFALAASGADNWDDKSYMPYYQDAPWWEDGKEASLPEDFYSSRFIVDKMIQYLGETDPAAPFLAYLSFQAIHIPVQAPERLIARYDGVYDGGWQALREARHARAQELGLVPGGAPLAPMPDGARAWESLSDEERAFYAAAMEVNAAMIEAMDHEVGRFVDHLKSQHQYENTIFVVTSDNGPEFARGDNDWRLALWMSLNGYRVSVDGIGGRGSWGFIGPEWAAAAASPSALFKFYAAEGGVRVPLIIAGPGVPPGRIDSPAMVSDIFPTLLDWVGAPEASASALPVTGRSLLPVLRGDVESAYGPNDIRAIEVSGNSALYRGEYKITRAMPPIGDGQWRLYHLASDPGETTDLAGVHPQLFADMLAAFDGYAEENGVLPMPEGYDTDKAVKRSSTERLVNNNGPILLGLGLVLLFGLYGLWRAIRAMARRKPA